MRKLLPAFLICAALGAEAQAYDIRVNFKGSPDTMVYLVKYQFDQQYIVDTCKNIRNGNIRVSGKKELE